MDLVLISFARFVPYIVPAGAISAVERWGISNASSTEETCHTGCSLIGYIGMIMQQ